MATRDEKHLAGQSAPTEKVPIHLRSVGDAPALTKSKYKLDGRLKLQYLNFVLSNY